MTKTPLRLAREKQQETILTVAAAVGIDPGNLSRIERGEQAPSLDTAARLAGYFCGSVTEMEILYPERFATPDPAPAEAGHA